MINQGNLLTGVDDAYLLIIRIGQISGPSFRRRPQPSAEDSNLVAIQRPSRVAE